jgi:hypothetical protein
VHWDAVKTLLASFPQLVQFPANVPVHVRQLLWQALANGNQITSANRLVSILVVLGNALAHVARQSAVLRRDAGLTCVGVIAA